MLLFSSATHSILALILSQRQHFAPRREKNTKLQEPLSGQRAAGLHLNWAFLQSRTRTCLTHDPRNSVAVPPAASVLSRRPAMPGSDWEDIRQGRNGNTPACTGVPAACREFRISLLWEITPLWLICLNLNTERNATAPASSLINQRLGCTVLFSTCPGYIWIMGNNVLRRNRKWVVSSFYNVFT